MTRNIAKICDWQPKVRQWLNETWGITSTEFQLRLLEQIPSSCRDDIKAYQWLTQYLSLQKIKPIKKLDYKLQDYYL